MNAKHTPGPWTLGEYDKTGGYDCMTAGIKAGPALLDGEEYGQEFGEPLDAEAKARMLADACLICAAPKLLAALEEAREVLVTAQQYFPTSIKNRDTFGLLNVLANSVSPAIKEAKGQSA